MQLMLRDISQKLSMLYLTQRENDKLLFFCKWWVRNSNFQSPKALKIKPSKKINIADFAFRVKFNSIKSGNCTVCETIFLCNLMNKLGDFDELNETEEKISHVAIGIPTRKF